MKNKTYTRYLRLGCFLVFSFLLYRNGISQISITTLGTTYTEDFTSLGTSAAATLPSGWEVNSNQDYSSGTTVTTKAAGTSGSGILTGTSAGGTYNFANGITATSTDRALGFLTNTSSFPPFSSPRFILIKITNNTGTVITNLQISFDIEKYRSGTLEWDISFYSSPDGSNWTSRPAGDQHYNADANNTTIYNPPTSISKTVTISGLSIADGDSYYLSWKYTKTSGTENNTAQALGIDNFSITAKASQSINFIEFTSPDTLGSAPFYLSAIASSGLPVTFESSDPSVATISNDSLVTIVGCGIATITASQSGNSAYLAALSVQRTLSVIPVAPVALAADSVNAGGFTAHWNSTPGATNYYVVVSSDSSFNNILAYYDASTALYYTITGLSAGDTYYYQIYAGSPGETSEGSNIIRVTTLSGNWIGYSSDWATGSNWTSGFVPTADSNVYITPGGAYQPEISGEAACKNLSISQGSTLTIHSTGSLSANGSVMNNEGTLVIESDASQTGSLITSGTIMGSGTVTLERYITGATWHNLSSPLSGQKILDFLTSNPIPTKPSSNIYGMEYYGEYTGGWQFFTISPVPSGDLEPGVGYMVRRDDDGIVSFSGTMTNSPFWIPVTRAGKGWNAVGNPFTSSIGMNAGTTSTNFLTYNAEQQSIDSSYAAIYLWEGTAYTTINNSSDPTCIQPGQGFIIKATSTAQYAYFTSAMQCHDNPSFYKKSSFTPWPEIKLNAKCGGDSVYTSVKFREGMTRGLDVTYDAGQFGGSTKLNIFSKLVDDNGVNFAIQCLPDTTGSDMVVPVGVVCSAGGTVDFTASITSLPEGYTAVLEDRELGVFTDLETAGQKYEIALPASTDVTDRFFLHTKYSTTNVDPVTALKIVTYAVDRTIYIKGEVPEKTRAALFDMSGRKLLDVYLEPSDMNVINAGNVKAGIYLVVLSGRGVQQTNKVMLH